MTVEAKQLKIDLADTEDIRAKLPHARAMLDQKRRVVKAAEREADNWALLVKRLEVLAGVDGVEKKRAGQRAAAPAQDAAVQIIEREGRLMRPPEVAGMMQAKGYPVTSTNAINAALYAAWQNKKLSRPRKGWYGPKDDDQTDGEIDDLLAVHEDAQI
jgi:hypothetical protein